MVAGSVTLLLGSEAALRDRFLQPLRKTLFSDPGASSLNEHYWDAAKPDATFSEILSLAQTAPFLAERRLIVIDHVESVKEAEHSILLQTIREHSAKSIWVLMTDERQAKTAWLRSLAALGVSRDCSTPYRESDIRGWIVKRFKELGKASEARLADLLIERVGKSLTLLDLAVERLVLYRKDAPSVAVADAEALLGRSAEENAFEILASVKTRGPGAALRIVRGLRSEGASVQEILSPLAYQFEQMLKVKNVLTLGLGAGDVAERFFYRNTYRAGQAVELARRLKPARLREDLETLIDCEEKIKRGELNETEALEACLLRLGETVEMDR